MSHNNFFSVCGVSTYFHFNQSFKQSLPVALMFTLGIVKYEKGLVRNTAIVMGVVENFPRRAPLLKILGRHHCL